MGEAVPRTIALHGAYVSALGAVLIVLGLGLPVWSVYHRTHAVKVEITIPGGPLRPAMIVLPAMPDGTIFAIAESEVTQAHFQRIMARMPGSVAHPGAESWQSCPAPFSSATLDLPVTCVTVAEAAAYANRLTEVENLARDIKGGQQLIPCHVDGGGRVSNAGCTGYRLPTRSEWQYAANLGADDPPSMPAQLCGHARLPNCPHPAAGPIKIRQLLPSAWYLYDIHGNAAELATVDAGGRPGSMFAMGGSFNYLPEANGTSFTGAGSEVGFRIVRSLHSL